ncbi:NUDIX domain-containing protein [Neobacillus sp. D3-1R]|uniref:NUDIX domain-containing protein n=1 Tax=Neobacillus sp. D3-1R TaxID=3445778 RepID=UPI003FA0650B
MAWKINHSLKLKVDRFEITSDKVSLPNGEEKTFSFVDFAKGVCVLPITEDHEVLVLKQYRHSIKDWQWELPAGAIDGIDLDPLETAKRELEEETGYVAEHWLELGSFFPSPGSTSEEIYLFAAAGLTPTEQNLESSEQLEVHKMSMEDLKVMIKNGEFKHGAGLAAIIKYKYAIE